MLLIRNIILLVPLIRWVLGAWESFYSPSSSYSYIRLQTNEIIPIYVGASKEQTLSNNQVLEEVIQPPTKSNYSLALANGELYAFYPSDENKLMISQLNSTSKGWMSISHDTTLAKDISFFYGSTLLTTRNTNADHQSIYIYGGMDNQTITDRLLEFDPKTSRINEVVLQVSPTTFFGAGSSLLDSSGTSSIVIGGRSESGWVSMFQIAIWEHQSWTFKTAVNADFSVNSRIDPLVLPIFENDVVDSVLVLGGELGGDLATPYALKLDMTNDWRWSNITNIGDFDINETLGAIVMGNTLVSININRSGKRDGNYVLNLYDVDDFSSKDVLSLETLHATANVNSGVATNSLHSSTQVVSSESNASTAGSRQTKAEKGLKAQEKKKTVAMAVTIPLLSLIIIATLSFFVYKRWSSASISIDDSSSTASTASGMNEEYYKEINDLDNQSLSSWNAKRYQYEHTSLNTKHLEINPPAKSTDRFTFDRPGANTKSMSSPVTQPLKKLKTIYKSQSPTTNPFNMILSPAPALHTKRPYSAFANPEDYLDRQELSTSYQSNRSRASIVSSSDVSSGTDVSHISEPEKAKHRTGLFNRFDEEEEQKIDDFLCDRDVQVLVSSKRRSKLRITNPDLTVDETGDEDNENNKDCGSNSNSSSSDELSNYNYDRYSIVDFSDVGVLDIDGEKEYFDDVLKVFDQELDGR